MTHYRDWLEARYAGHEAVRRFFSEWLDVWDHYEAGVDEHVTVPDGRIVTLAWQRGRGRHSGLVMDMEWAQITSLRDGRIIRIDNYDDHSEALGVVGLAAAS